VYVRKIVAHAARGDRPVTPLTNARAKPSSDPLQTFFPSADDHGCELFLGVNDDNFVDSSGTWTAAVDVESGT
jgi:hypothetical protein